MDVTVRRRIAAAAATGVAVAALAIPVFAASPSPTAGPSATAKAHGQGNGLGSGQGDGHGNGAHAKPEKSHGPETAVTLQGTVTKATDADGHATYSLTSGGTTYVLSFGPWWFWGDRNPLDGYVGKAVTVVGEREGSTGEVDVESVDGKALREAGRPPWAGGPKVVGPAHPGYEAWKAARDAAKPKASPNP